MPENLITTLFPAQKATRAKVGRLSSLAQIVAMQQTLHDFTVDKNVRPIEASSCARAWADLEERKRILRGKPLPGAYKPTLIPKHKRPDVVVMGD